MPTSLTDFIKDRELRGVSKTTVIWYQRFLTAWEKFAGDNQCKEKLRDFLSQYQSGQTQAGAYRAVRALELWRESENGQFSWIRKCKGWHFPPAPTPDIMTVDEFERICLTLTKPDHYAHFHQDGERDRIILSLLFWTGARATSILNLQRHHIDFENRTLRVKTKGEVDSTIAMPEETSDELYEYCKKYTILSGLVFKTDTNKPVRIGNITRSLKHSARKVGITHRVWIHGLRHAAATRMLERCGDIAAVQRQLLHRNINTTRKYAQTGIAQAHRAVDA